MYYFRFFYTIRTFYRPTYLKKFNNPLNYYFWKVKKFHGDNIKNESAKAKKTRGGGAPNAPPPACLGLKETMEKLAEINTFRVRKSIVSSSYLIRLRFKGTVVNRTLLFLQGWSLEITLRVPLNCLPHFTQTLSGL